MLKPDANFGGNLRVVPEIRRKTLGTFGTPAGRFFFWSRDAQF
jgi:hypothetical protein